jgi:hypothetical protein
MPEAEWTAFALRLKAVHQALITLYDQQLATATLAQCATLRRALRAVYSAKVKSGELAGRQIGYDKADRLFYGDGWLYV